MKLVKREVPVGNGVGSEHYLKLSSGQSVVGVFMGEAYEFWQKWPFGGEKQVFTEYAPGAKSRFKLNFVVKAENGVMISKVWEFGLGTFNELAEINAEYPLEKTPIKITRKGEGKKTEYHLMPMLKEELTKAHLAKIAAVKLHILDINPEVTPADAAEETDEDSDALPF